MKRKPNLCSGSSNHFLGMRARKERTREECLLRVLVMGIILLVILEGWAGIQDREKMTNSTPCTHSRLRNSDILIF